MIKMKLLDTKHILWHKVFHRLGIDYDETYSPVMDIITFRYLISLLV